MSEHEAQAYHVARDKDRIPFSQLVAFGFGGIIPIALFNIAGQLMGLIGNISLGLSAFWLGVILIIPRLWDAVSDPIVGHISDNTRTRWGRRRPFLLFGGLAVAVSFVLMWWIPDANWVHNLFPTESAYQWFQLSYILLWLLVFFTACTIFEIPHGALGMEMTSDYHERTRLFSAKSFLGNLFAMSTPWLFALANMELFRGTGGNLADGMRYVSMMVAAILIPLSFWWFFAVREPGFQVAAKQKKTPFWKDMKHTITNKTFLGLVVTIFSLAMGFNFVNLLGYYIPIFYIFGGDKSAAATLLGINGTVWAVTGLLAVFPLNWLSPKLGKRDTLLVSIGLMCLAQLSKIVCYNPDYPFLIIIPTVLLSSGMLFFFTLGASMVGDICDEDDFKTGKRSEGSYYSIFWWFIKMGTAFASFVAGALIVFTQFDETQVTQVDAFQGAISEARSQVERIEEYQHLTPPLLYQRLNEDCNETLDKSKEFLFDLQAEVSRKQQQGEKFPESQFKLYASIENEMKITVHELGEFQTRLQNSDFAAQNVDVEPFIESITPLLLQTSLQTIRKSSEELKILLNEKLHDNAKQKKHVEELIYDFTRKDRLLSNLQASDKPEHLLQQLDLVEKNIVQLSSQSPYTLFMMRAVEIALPILLSLISVLFALKYPLNEKRCYEIKAALEDRNKKRAKDDQTE